MPEEKYNLKINRQMYEVFEKYVKEHVSLGYRSVSELLNDILRRAAKKILKGEDIG